MRVSLPLTAEGGRIHAALAAFCVMVALAVGAAASAPSPYAAFALNKCEEPQLKARALRCKSSHS